MLLPTLLLPTLLLFYDADRPRFFLPGARCQGCQVRRRGCAGGELEAIRSRTREALRSRVRAGRIAGGRCYGYRLDRKQDETGRPYTVAVVEEDQAAVVQRIYDEYLHWGRGLKAIAHKLNEEGIPSPTVGRRGSGAWAPSGIRAMLRNPRYRGIYMHGKVKKVRRGGKVQRVKADPKDVIVIDVPEWRIVEDETWFAVQELFINRDAVEAVRGARAAKYPLSGVGRCGVCGGSIGSARTKVTRNQRVQAYACTRYHSRGRAACSASAYQESRQVEESLLAHLQEHVLTPAVVDSVLAEIRAEVEREFATQRGDTGPLEAELKKVRAEQRKLAKGVAVADDVPELLAELRLRQNRIRYLETEIAASERAPELVAELRPRSRPRPATS